MFLASAGLRVDFTGLQIQEFTKNETNSEIRRQGSKQAPRSFSLAERH